jgi:hypothetical protein
MFLNKIGQYHDEKSKTLKVDLILAAQFYTGKTNIKMIGLKRIIVSFFAKVNWGSSS